MRKAAAPGGAHADAERLQRLADRILQIEEELALQIAPVRQQQPQPVAGLVLDMRPSELAGVHDVRQAGRIGVVPLRRQRGAPMLVSRHTAGKSSFNNS